jgi:amidohydrolase
VKAQANLRAVLPQAIELRHRLHRIPELGYEEERTAQMIRQTLAGMGIDFIAGAAGAATATIALIGDAKKPCVALRADIDALPIEEKTGLPYASEHAGKMHACGHDGHMATLCAAAAVLMAEASALPVCVKLIFQPAEEGGAGAERLTKAGVLDGGLGPKVRAIFGLHGWPELAVGTVSTKAGPLLAATDGFVVSFRGRGCHGAYPHLGRDPIVAACEAVLNIQQVVSRDIDPTDPVVVTVGQIAGGTAMNVIPDVARIVGTVRTLSEQSRVLAKAALERRCDAIARAAGCEVDFQWEAGYPVTQNDAAMADYVAKTAAAELGTGRFIPTGRASMGGEDFAYYLEKVPGCFFFVGVRPEQKQSYPSLHSDHFDFTDEAIETGARMFVRLVKSIDVAALEGKTK